jgi:hypothetical protein
VGEAHHAASACDRSLVDARVLAPCKWPFLVSERGTLLEAGGAGTLRQHAMVRQLEGVGGIARADGIGLLGQYSVPQYCTPGCGLATPLWSNIRGLLSACSGSLWLQLAGVFQEP